MDNHRRYLDRFQRKIDFQVFILIELTELVAALNAYHLYSAFSPDSDMAGIEKKRIVLIEETRIRIAVENLSRYVDYSWTLNLVQLYLLHPKFYFQFEAIASLPQLPTLASDFWQDNRLLLRTYQKSVDVFRELTFEQLNVIEKIVVKIKDTFSSLILLFIGVVYK